MQGYTTTYKAMFPEPVEIKELSLVLRPITLAHFCVIEALGADLLGRRFTREDCLVAAWLLATKSDREASDLFAVPSSVEKARADAFAWGLTFDVSAASLIRIGVIRAVNAAYETAARPETPPADGPSKNSLDGPSNSPSNSPPAGGAGNT